MSPRERPEEWLHRPDVFAGVVLGGIAAAQSFSPSLMPRRTGHQALVSGVAAALGFTVGGATYGLVTRTGSEAADLGLSAGLVVGGAGVSRLLPRQPHEPTWRSVARSVADLTAAGGVATGAVVAARGSRRRFVGGLVVAGGATAVGVRGVRRGLAAQQAAQQEQHAPIPAPLPALGQSIGVAAAITAVVNGYRSSGAAIARIAQRRLGLRVATSHWVGDGLAMVLWAGTAKALSNSFVAALRTYDRVVDTGFDRAPDTPLRSAGPGSPLAFARLGREGRRFVTNVPDAEEIEAATGRAAVAEPVRVFVGYACARSDEARVGLALDELRRTGAFDRSILVVGCPAGNGYVNTLPLEVVDLLTGGDAAAVAVQYGRLPSLLTLNRVTRGARVHRALLTAIGEELAGRDPADRPRVVVYGESLGAWAGQDAFLHRGVEGLDELGVSRALWAGTPYYSGWRHEVLLADEVPVPTGSVVEVEDSAALAAVDGGPEGPLRALIVSNDNDPVRHLAASLLVRQPGWLDEPRPARVPREMRFTPVVTAVQVIVDALNAMRPTPGTFRATGHEYTAVLPAATRVAYGLDGPAGRSWEDFVAHLEATDAARAAANHLPADPEPAGEADAGVDGDRPAGAHGHRSRGRRGHGPMARLSAVAGRLRRRRGAAHR